MRDLFERCPLDQMEVLCNSLAYILQLGAHADGRDQLKLVVILVGEKLFYDQTILKSNGMCDERGGVETIRGEARAQDYF